jgi:hypothetical protein
MKIVQKFTPIFLAEATKGKFNRADIRGWEADLYNDLKRRGIKEKPKAKIIGSGKMSIKYPNGTSILVTIDSESGTEEEYLAQGPNVPGAAHGMIHDYQDLLDTIATTWKKVNTKMEKPSTLKFAVKDKKALQGLLDMRFRFRPEAEPIVKLAGGKLSIEFNVNGTGGVVTKETEGSFFLQATKGGYSNSFDSIADLCKALDTQIFGQTPIKPYDNAKLKKKKESGKDVSGLNAASIKKVSDGIKKECKHALRLYKSGGLMLARTIKTNKPYVIDKSPTNRVPIDSSKTTDTFMEGFRAAHHPNIPSRREAIFAAPTQGGKNTGYDGKTYYCFPSDQSQYFHSPTISDFYDSDVYYSIEEAVNSVIIAVRDYSEEYKNEFKGGKTMKRSDVSSGNEESNDTWAIEDKMYAKMTVAQKKKYHSWDYKERQDWLDTAVKKYRETQKAKEQVGAGAPTKADAMTYDFLAQVNPYIRQFHGLKIEDPYGLIFTVYQYKREHESMANMNPHVGKAIKEAEKALVAVSGYYKGNKLKKASDLKASNLKKSSEVVIKAPKYYLIRVDLIDQFGL